MLKDIQFYFDFTSPYSYLAFNELLKSDDSLEGISLKPVMVGKIISSVGSVGPGEIKPKREYLFKDCLRRANKSDIKLVSPARMPFSPLPLLRLVIALAGDPCAQREMTAAIFNFGWRDGHDYEDFEKLNNYLCKEMNLSAEQLLELENSKEARRGLKLNIKEALECECFGVPYFYDKQNGEGFWGLDSLEFLHAHRLGQLVETQEEFKRFVNILEGVGND